VKFGRLDRYRFDQLTDEQCGVVESLHIALTGKMPRPIVDDSGRITGGFNYLLIEPWSGSHTHPDADACTAAGPYVRRRRPHRGRRAPGRVGRGASPG